MKTVLFVAQDSFPLHGAESIVNIKLLSALSNSGEFTIDLISKKAKGESYGSNTLNELGIRIRHLNVLEVENKVNLSSIWKHVLCWIRFGIVFKGSHWAHDALKIALRLCKNNRYDYVLTKNQASVLVGYYLKRHLGLKWIATWNDPFPSSLYPSIYAEYMHESDGWAYRKIIDVTKRYVDSVVIPSVRLRDYLLPLYGMPKERSVVIPHVVNKYRINKSTKDKKDILRIIHSGNISYPRDPEIFFKGLSMFVTKHPSSRLNIDILGVANKSICGQIAKYGLTNIVNVINPVSYLDSLKLLGEYDVALVVEAKLEEGIFLPTKVSDFMQCQKAIFAVSPPKGVLNDLFKNGYIGYFADNNDAVSVLTTMEIIYKDYINNEIKPSKIPVEYSEEYVVQQYLMF